MQTIPRIGALVLAALCLAGSAPYAAPAARVRGLRVEGNLRIPAATVLHHISLVSGSPLTRATVEADLRKLKSLGIFSRIEVATEPAGESAVDVTFRVAELPFVSAFAIEGASEAMTEQMRELLGRGKVSIRSGEPYRPEVARKAALAMRSFLRERGHPSASVEVEEEPRGSTVRIMLKIRAGPHIELGALKFDGNHNLSDEELRREMEHTGAASLWPSRRWAYVPERLASDIERLRRHYRSRGYAQVEIGKPEIIARIFITRRLFPFPVGSRKREKLEIRIPVTEGPRFRLASIGVEGDPGAASAEIAELMNSVETPRVYDRSLLEATREKIVSALGHAGYALAQVRLEERPDQERGEIHARYRIDAGEPMVVGRVQFEGNFRLPDRFLRRELSTAEGEIFDSSRLDDSLEQLNGSDLVQEIRRSDVDLHYDADRQALDITIKVKEKDRQGIFATGGTGGAGGYLGILYAAFNLLGLGEALTVELDGGAAQSNILLDLVARRFLGSPFLLALSGFHRYTKINVASIVPGPEDLVSVFRRRSTGFAWSGSYSVTRASRIGLGVQVERESVVQGAGEDDSARVTRSALSPSFVFDSVRGHDAAARGSRFTVSHGFVSSAFLGTVLADRPSALYSLYVDDPVTRGRNAFAFRVYGSMTRPRRDAPLPVEQRFFPGEELVRGFGSGALSPWAVSEQSGVATAGAETGLGFSAEYRAPVQGPLTSAAFLDLGWSRLSAGVLNGGAGKSLRLIEETNRLVRASAGGELRLKLPVIRGPARLIFAWNFLGLDRMVKNASSGPLRLADPRGTIRFALGNVF